MAKQTVAFRVSEQEKNYIYDLTGSLGVPLSKFMSDLHASLKNGDVNYDGNKFSGVNTEIEGANTNVNCQVTVEGNPEGLNLDELYSIAKSRRVTPQSILDNALRPYRGKNFT